MAETNDTDVLAMHLAASLGETKPEPISLIKRTIRALGPERAQAIADEAMQVYAGEGMPTKLGDRKRTAGGIFFHLARDRASKKERQQMTPWLGSDHQPRKRKPMNAAFKPPKPEVEQVMARIEASSLQEIAALTDMGAAGMLSTTSLKLIGRPGSVKTTGAYVFFTLVAEKVPALPKDIPPFQARTNYLVIVGAKQWAKVSDQLALDPEARFLIEGYPTVQPGFTGITVAALNCALVAKKQK